MERLTFRVSDDVARLICRIEKGACVGKTYTCPDTTPGCPEIIKALNKLADYEDTGLEPREVKAKCAWADKMCKMLSDIFGDSGVFDFSHFKELSKAEQDGRLLVLPCKGGGE